MNKHHFCAKYNNLMRISASMFLWEQCKQAKVYNKCYIFRHE